MIARTAVEAVAPSHPRLPLAAWGALAGSGIFVALLAILHVIKPEIDPSWRFVSEYAIGAHGWMMSLAFLALAAAFASLAVSVGPQLRRLAGRLGWALLLVSAVGLALAGLFTTDPITATPEAATTGGQIHALGGALGLAMPFAVALVTWRLAKEPAWAAARRRLIAAAALAVASSVFALVILGAMLSQSGGTFGPEVKVGWANRAEILAYCVWVAVVAHAAAGVGGRRGAPDL